MGKSKLHKHEDLSSDRKLAMATYTDITPTLKSVETRRFLVLLAISLVPDVFERFYSFTYHVHYITHRHI